MFLSLNDLDTYPRDTTSLTMGHSHLQRGGWAKMMRIPQIRQPAYASVMSPFVSEPVNRGARDHIDRWFAIAQESTPGIIDRLKGRAAGDAIPVTPVRPLDKLFWSYEFFRVSKYLQTLRLFYEPHMLCVWPFLGERFIRVAAGIDLKERTREMAVFRATVGFAPQLRDLPLWEARYRFERGGRNDLFSECYEAQDPANISNDQAAMKIKGRTRAYIAPVRTIADTILSSSTWTDLRPGLTPETVDAIEHLAERGWKSPPGIKGHSSSNSDGGSSPRQSPKRWSGSGRGSLSGRHALRLLHVRGLRFSGS